MAATKVKSVLAGKYGTKLDSAVKAHASDETKYGLIAIPGGIANGVALLTKCYFKEYGKDSGQKKADGTSAVGEYFFRAEGTVVSPKIVATPDGIIPIEGLTTSIMIPLCDTKRGEEVVSQDESIQRVLNEMRKLGGPQYTKGASAADLESLAAGLEQANIYFRFNTVANTSKPDKDGKTRVFVNEYWNGSKGMENYQQEEGQLFNESNDKTVATPSPEKVKKVTQPQVPEKRIDDIVPVSELAVDDLLAMATSEADSAQEARERLTEMAIAAGYSPEEVASEEVGWDDVVNMINTPKNEEEENKEKAPPKKGETCKYAPKSKKDPKVYLPLRECQVLSVDDKKKTVTLKDLTLKGVEYKDVEWHNLED